MSSAEQAGSLHFLFFQVWGFAQGATVRVAQRLGPLRKLYFYRSFLRERAVAYRPTQISVYPLFFRRLRLRNYCNLLWCHFLL